MAIITNNDGVNKKMLKARIPIVPIDLTKVEDSTNGEIIIDYDNKKLLAKSKDGNEIIDLTGDIRQENKNNGLSVGFTVGSKPLPHRYMYDKRSIDDTNKLIRLLDFDKANADYIPFKSSEGYLRWGYVFDVIKSDMCRNTLTANVVENNLIILKAGNIYTSSGITKGNVKLVAGNTTYCKILWRLNTGVVTSITFDPNVTFSDTDLIKSNSTVDLVIESWDSGATWSITSDSANYNKTDTDSSLSWGYEDNGVTNIIGKYKMRSTKTMDGYLKSTKDNNTFYFVEETSQIFRGNKSFSNPFIVVDQFPATGIAGRLYINRTTLEGKIYLDGWFKVISPSTSTINDATNDNDFLVTKKAIVDYVKKRLSTTMLEDTDNNKIVSIGGLKSVIVDTITTITDYDEMIPSIKAVKEYVSLVAPDKAIDTIVAKDNVGITVNYTNGDSQDIAISTPKEIKSATVSNSTKTITLTRNDGSKLNIDLTALLGNSGGSGGGSGSAANIQNSETITAKSSGDSYILDVNILNKSNNALIVTTDDGGNYGLFVPKGITGLESGNDDELLLSSGSSMKRSGLKISNKTVDVNTDKVIPTLKVINDITDFTSITNDNKTDFDNNVSTKIYYSTIDIKSLASTNTFFNGMSKAPFIDANKLTSLTLDKTVIDVSKLVYSISTNDGDMAGDYIKSSDGFIYLNRIYTLPESGNIRFAEDIKLTTSLSNHFVSVSNNGLELNIYSIFDLTDREIEESEVVVDFNYTSSTTDLSLIKPTCTVNVNINGESNPASTIEGVANWKYNYSDFNPNNVEDTGYLVYVLFTPSLIGYAPLTIPVKLLSHKS